MVLFRLVCRLFGCFRSVATTVADESYRYDKVLFHKI
jgi:hypothetical protein